MTPEHERYLADAAVLAQIGAALFPQPTRVRVCLPRALADLAVAAWARDEDGDHAAAPSQESAEQATARHRAGTLALIGLAIETASGGIPAGDNVLADLDAWHIGSALDAADHAGLLASLTPSDPEERPQAQVFLLWHISHAPRKNMPVTRHLDEDGDPLCDEQAGDNVKLLGVYPSETAARARIETARKLPGFSDEPDCFQTTQYTVGKDEWVHGYITTE